MTTQHTPGPWETDGQAIWAKDNYYITAEIVAGESDEECKANALLMAAAPDLLTALENVIYEAQYESEWLEARAAIAKATGATKD